MIHFIKKSQYAFTLAEVLVSLFLIGVAAMMMIPVVKTVTPDQNLPKKWKDNFYNIVLAQSAAKDEINKKLTQETNAKTLVYPSDDLFKTMLNYLDIKENCGDSEFVCGTNQIEIGQGDKNVYKTMSEGHLDKQDLYKNQLLLSNGANIYEGNNLLLVSIIWIDVNGYQKGPNVLGKDLFGLILTWQGVIPLGGKGTSANISGSNSCSAKDQYVPIIHSAGASDYAGASCSLTKLFQNNDF